MERPDGYYRRGPSFFFPIALITLGVVWLLVNGGIVPVENIYRVLPYWPVFLILGGISILLRRWWPANLLLWVGAAALLVVALITPPAFMTRVSPAEIQHQVLTEPVGPAKSADARLDLSIYSAKVHALSDATNLIYADLYTAGPAKLDVTGAERKTAHLSWEFNNYAWWRFDQFITPSSQAWDIGLTGAIPLDLTVDASTGSSNLDLTGIKLNSLNINASTGSMTLQLPAGQKISQMKLDCSTGSMRVTVPEGTSANMNIKASTGSLTIDIPASAGAQVTVTDGSTGSLSLQGFKKVRGAAEANNKEGVYENDAFSSSKSPITMTIDMSTGSVTVR